MHMLYNIDGLSDRQSSDPQNNKSVGLQNLYVPSTFICIWYKLPRCPVKDDKSVMAYFPYIFSICLSPYCNYVV